MRSAIARRYRLAGRRVYARAVAQNDENIARALAAHAPLESLLDLGCDDGTRTSSYAQAAGALDVHGIEVVESRAALARARGISVVSADLGAPLPFEDQAFDAVVSNQVIEHLFDTDLFLAEAFRVLKVGGVVVTSTENLASWHNVASLLLGWQPFSLTNVSSAGSIGNPLGLAVGGDYREHVVGETTWQHHRVFTTRGLRDLHRAHGFTALRSFGSGYYPLPSRMGRINPAHAAFITVSGQRI
jgi:SAM-dependent methyltransferase